MKLNGNGRPPKDPQNLKIIMDYFRQNNSQFTVYIALSPLIFDDESDMVNSGSVKACLLNSDGVVSRTGDVGDIALSEAIKVAFSTENSNRKLNAKRLIASYAKKIRELCKIR